MKYATEVHALDTACAVTRTARREATRARAIHCPNAPAREQQWRDAMAEVERATAALLAAMGGCE